MTAFTVVYIQLTALQVGAKYLEMDLIAMKKTKKQLKKNCENCRYGYWESDGDYGEYNYFVCEKREDNGYNNLENNLYKESYRQKAKICCELMVSVTCKDCGAVEFSN